MGTIAGSGQIGGPDTLTAVDLLTIAQQHQAEVVAFLQDLVRLPSVNGRDDELIVAQRVVEEGRHLGLQVRPVL